ncbi:MAG: endonuclease/exonuclease/phosphatase family protein [Hyphomicrobium sp.]
MRIATFNLENLDLPPKARMSLVARAAVLRPAFARLQADIVCLQEVNGQRVRGQSERSVTVLDQLLAGTPYASFHRASTTGPDRKGAADVHNLVTLSRLPIIATREVRHDFVPPVAHAIQTASPKVPSASPLTFDRPLLQTDIDIGNGRRLTVINLHLRAPLAAFVAGQKQAPFVWKSVAGWAEGYFMSAVRREAQALELRFLVDRCLADDPKRLIAIAGDFNAEDHDTSLKIAIGAEEETGNGDLSAHSLVVLDRALPADRRWSVLHYGRPQMLDHILTSRALHGHFRTIEIHNETLGDEAMSYAKAVDPPGSHHAAVVAEFAFDGAWDGD